MVIFWILFSTLVLFQRADSVIHTLNITEYSRMPPIYDLDDYEVCMDDPKGLYCILKLKLVSDEPSPLLDMIREYSEDTVKHFNHSILDRGTCVTRTCNKYYNDKTELKSTLEKCFNESLWSEYKLRARVKDDYVCDNHDNVLSPSMDITNADMIVAALCFILLLLNVVGSLYDIWTDGNGGIKTLLCFSIRRNWSKLVEPVTKNVDPRLDRLSSFYGIRCIILTLIAMAHSNFTIYIYVSNTQYVEHMYNYLPFYFIYNGALVVHVFFVISGFLMVYNMQLHEEKYKLRWITLPKNIVLRWLRFSAPYAFALAVTSTWQRFSGAGPTWDKYVMQEVRDCRSAWWQHLLYINNYFQGTCYQQTWYLAVDMQLYIGGLIVYFACRSTRSRVIVLSLLGVIGVISPALHIYFQDLDGAVMVIPTYCSKFYIDYPEFIILHRMTHNNITGYVIGMSLGYIVYYLQRNEFNIQKYKIYRIIYWSLLPVAASIFLLGSIFYNDGPRCSIWLRVLYGSLSKPIFSLILAAFLFGLIFEYERYYRSFLEWRGWLIPARLSFSVYLLHISYIKLVLGSRNTTTYVSLVQITEQGLFIIVYSYILAFMLSLFVERPYTELYNVVLKNPLSSEVKTKKLQ